MLKDKNIPFAMLFEESASDPQYVYQAPIYDQSEDISFIVNEFGHRVAFVTVADALGTETATKIRRESPDRDLWENAFDLGTETITEVRKEVTDRD